MKGRLLGCMLMLAPLAAAVPQEFQLPNGLKVALSENHDRPLVRLEFRSRWRPAEEPAGRAGISGFLVERLQAGGAGPLKRESFQAFLAERALRFQVALRPASFAWSVLAGSQSQDSAFECLAMAVTRPDLDVPQIEAQRQRAIQALKERTPRERAEDHFRRCIQEPGGLMKPQEGSLDGLAASDLNAWFRRIVRPGNSVLVIQGDMNLAQARQLAMLHLGAWGPEPGPPEVASPAAETPKPRTWLIQNTGDEVQVQAGGPPPGPSLPDVELMAWLVNRRLAHEHPPELAASLFETFPNGAWRLTARPAPGRSAAEAALLLQALTGRLSRLTVGTAELGAARLAWHAKRQARALHPRQEAEALAEAVLAAGTSETQVDALRTDQLQEGLRKWLSSPCYLVTGGLSTEAPLLEKAGLGPVEIVN